MNRVMNKVVHTRDVARVICATWTRHMTTNTTTHTVMTTSTAATTFNTTRRNTQEEGTQPSVGYPMLRHGGSSSGSSSHAQSTNFEWSSGKFPTPGQMQKMLDKHVIGQDEAKKVRLLSNLLAEYAIRGITEW